MAPLPRPTRAIKQQTVFFTTSSTRPYRIFPSAHEQRERLLLHEQEHVEEAVVARGRKALRQAHRSDPLGRQPCDLLHRAAAQALYQQRRQALPEEQHMNSRLR